MTAAVVRAEQRGPLRWLWLNRPQVRNALNDELICGLRAELERAEADPNVAVLVIAGAGAGFCAGADLRHLLALNERGVHPVDFLRTVSGCFSAVADSPLTVIAALHGHAVAGGLELAVSCDLVVAEEGTLIGDGHVRNNLVPAGGSSVRLAERAGGALARRLLLTGELLPAEELVACGLITAVAPRGALIEEVERLAGELTRGHTSARTTVKRLLGHSQRHMHALLEEELAVFREHWDNQDVGPALRRFLDRPRSPTGTP